MSAQHGWGRGGKEGKGRKRKGEEGEETGRSGKVEWKARKLANGRRIGDGIYKKSLEES